MLGTHSSFHEDNVLKKGKLPLDEKLSLGQLHFLALLHVHPCCSGEQLGQETPQGGGVRGQGRGAVGEEADC